MTDAVRSSSLADRFTLGLFRRRAHEGQADESVPRGGLFRKYVLLLVGLVALVLLLNAGFDFWFSYEETKAALFHIQQEKAASAARRIEGFVDEIERQLGWTTAPQWAAGPIEQRRFDYVRLLRQVPAITELIQLDDAGREQLKVSRLAVDVVGSGKTTPESRALPKRESAGSGSARSISARNRSRTLPWRCPRRERLPGSRSPRSI
jgi:hypothetical protein